MKHSKKLRYAIGQVGILLGLLVGTDVALAQTLGNPQVVPPTVSEFGNTYGEWSARWCQWLLSIPAATNPNLDTTGAECAEAQTGQVWFLAGTFGGPSVTRSCTIPGGKDLFFPIRNTLFGEGVGDCTGPNDCDPTALRGLAAKDVDNPSLEVSIDHINLKNLDQYRVTSPVLTAFFPQGAVLGLQPGTHGPLVSDGFWVLLKPLSRGMHTIHFKSVTPATNAPPFVVDVTYLLTVKE